MRRPIPRLTDEAVGAILMRLAAGESRRMLAAEYGVTVDAVRHIAIGKTWRHLPRPEAR